MNKNTPKEHTQEQLKKNTERLVAHSESIGKGLYSTLIGLPKNIAQWLRHAAKLWDINISEKEFISQLSKKDPSFVKKSLQFIEKWMLRWLYITIIAGSLWYWTHKVISNNNSSAWIEVIEELKDDDEVTTTYNPTIQEIVKTPTNNTYRDSNIDFFDQKKFNEAYPRETVAEWVRLIRDVGMSFYIVQEWDNPKKIRKKLKQIPEFSYLDDEKYDPKNKVSSFNVPKSSIVPGLFIPVPLPQEIREVSLEDFTSYAVQAVEEMKQEWHYSTRLQNLLTHTTHDELIATIVTFARCETAQDHTSFSDNIWSVTYHRREPHMSAFSFTPFHILMERNADGKTPWPWLQARLNLKMTEWQAYHPKNACKLFLAYRFEKTKNMDITKYLPITEQNIISTAKLYNGSVTYAPKLGRNYTYIVDQREWETSHRSQTTKLKWESFIFVWYNSTGEHKIYKYIIKQWGNPWWVAQKLLEENDNINLANIIISDANGKVYKSNHSFESGDVVYVKIK